VTALFTLNVTVLHLYQ